MSIKIYKAMSGVENKTKKPLDIEFETFEAAEQYVNSNIIPNESPYKYVTFKVQNITKSIPVVREYMYLDDNDFHVYSYRIVQEND
jgi:hypothetical protein